MVDAIVFEHMPYGVHQLICQYGEVHVGINPLIILMVNRFDIQIGFQASESRLSHPYSVVYVPKAAF
jgi:hypothetical protein